MWLSFIFVRSFFLSVASDLNLRAPLAVKQSVSFRGGTEAQTLKKSVEERVSRWASEAQLTDWLLGEV